MGVYKAMRAVALVYNSKLSGGGVGCGGLEWVGVVGVGCGGVGWGLF